MSGPQIAQSRSHSMASPDTLKAFWYSKGFQAGQRVSQDTPEETTQLISRLSYELEESNLRLKEESLNLKELSDVVRDLLPVPSNNEQESTTRKQTYASIVARLAPPTFTAPATYYSQLQNAEEKVSLEQALQSIFKAAHEGNDSAFGLIKTLCREAHATESKNKTYGQRYILAKWRNPHVTPSPLGASAPTLSNPQSGDPPEVWAAYLNQYPRSLPKGVRRHPTTGTPVFSDVVASRIFAHLRPTTHLRVEFAAAMTTLFTTPGRYRSMVHEHKWCIPDTHCYCAYDKETEVVYPLDVAKHYASCGISVEEVEKTVEPWAAQYAIDHSRSRR